MIYPILNINQNNQCTISIIDNDEPEPVIIIEESTDNVLPTFYTLLCLFISQYNIGYGDGYEDGYADRADEDGMNEVWT